MSAFRRRAREIAEGAFAGWLCVFAAWGFVDFFFRVVRALQ